MLSAVFSPSYLPLSNHHLVDSQVQFSFGKGFCRITSPQLFMIPKTTNNQSLIVDCDVNDTSFLITGDSDQSVELLAIRSGVITPVDALKLAHHGSRSSNSMALLNATNPNFVWNSAGKDNWFGHPHQLVVDRILARNIEMKSTHLHGSIVIKL